MKKVLILINSAVGRGAEKVLRDLLKSINLKDYEIDLFLLSEEGIYLNEFSNYSKNIDYLIRKESLLMKKNFLFKIFRVIYIKLFLLQIIKKLPSKYDIEISFLEGLTAEYISRRKTKSLKVGWIHTDLLKLKIPFWIKSDVYKKFDKIVCVSQNVKKSLLKLYPDLEKKSEVIYNPIIRGDVINKSKISLEENEEIDIISIGSLNYEKGFDNLLKIQKALKDENLKYRLVIIGEGKERDKLEKYIKENRLEEYVKLIGYKENPYPYLKKSKIFVLSSRYEGFSLVLIEAMLLNLPIISTDCAGPRELLSNGKYGILVKNQEELKESIKLLMKNSKLRKKYSELSKIRMNIFDENKIIESIEKLLKNK